MIEATIFLHQDDDMLDIHDRARLHIGRDRCRARDRCGKRGQRGTGDACTEQCTTGDIGHRGNPQEERMVRKRPRTMPGSDQTSSDSGDGVFIQDR